MPQYNIVTTGKGMLKPGKIIGNIEATTIDKAIEKIKKILEGRPFIWELKIQ